jgi:hypothetical protein
MTHLMMAGALLVLAAAACADDFTRTMTAEERTAAGLDKLTAEELARLAAAVERYKSGEVAVVRHEAEQKVAVVRQEAAVKVAAAEAKAQVAAPGAGRQPGWLGALITLRRTEQKLDEAEELEVRLAGTLRSFSGRRNFTLENGQVWQMIEAGSYAGPRLESPVVTIRPGMMGSFWLKVPAAGLRVKVKPVKLE